MLRISHFSFVFLFISSSIIISCNSNDHKVKDHSVFRAEDFKSSDSLKGEVLSFPSSKKPSTIKVIPEKNLLIVNDPESGFLAKAYTLDSLKLLKSFIKKGEGPNEQLAIVNFNYLPGDQLLYAADLYKKILYAYSIDSILSPEAEVWPVGFTSLRSAVVNRPVVFQKDKIADFRPNRGNDPVAVLNFYNQKGELLSYNGQFPALDKEFEAGDLISIFSGATSLTEDRSKIIVSYFYTDYLDLYDTLGNLKKRVQGPGVFEPNFESRLSNGINTARPTKNTRLGYRRSSVFHNDIFALYDGGLTSRDGYHVSSLVRFNDTLAPLSMYKLDKPIFDFDIDSKNGLLYGLTHETAESIVIFKL